MFGFATIMLISWIIWMIFRASKVLGVVILLVACFIIAALSGTI